MTDGRPSRPRIDREASVRAAAEHLRAGRDQQGLEAAQEALQEVPGDVAALHLAGVALTRLGRVSEALQALGTAAHLAPESSPCHLALGNALRKQGDLPAALRALQRAVELDAGNAAARYQLAQAQREAGAPREAVATLHALASRDPMDFDASQRLVGWIAEDVIREPLRPAATRPAHDTASPWARVSVGFCTIDPVREAKAREALQAALGPAPCDFHIVRNPRSLAEGFNQVLDAAQGDVVILCHDDIAFLTPRLDLALQRALASADIAGVAGATRVGGPAVLWSGHPHVHGWVTYPRGDALEVAPLSLRSGVIPGMQALDGVFIALRREAAQALRFDAQVFDGFHFYDLDFTYRAHRAGLRLCVTTDVLLTHASEGTFAESWRGYAGRFMGKFPELRQPQGQPHWYGARLPSASHAIAFYETLRALDRAAASNGIPA
jgi:tetratricopeptide (TPR) repeat protein